MPPTNPQGVIKRRSRNGCRTCRDRHQKCDERKPACWNCRLRGVECGGYGVILTDFTTYSGQKGQMVSRMTRAGDEPELNAAEGSDSRQLLDGVELPAAGSPSTPALFGNQPSRAGLESGLGSLPEIPETHGFSTGFIGVTDSASCASMGLSPIDLGMFGCWTPDDATREPIDTANKAIAENEAESGIGSLQEPQATASTNQDDQGNILDYDSALFQTVQEFSIPPIPQDPFDQYLFSHYMDTLSLRLYPIKLDQNPYRIVYGSLAIESEPLLKVIMLASALHLAKLGKLPAFAIKHYRTAVRDSFRTALEGKSSASSSAQNGSTSEMWSLGVTVLLSVVFEIISTGIDIWSSKLIGCRRLLEMAMRSSPSPPGFQCVLMQYNWVVTMGKAILRGSVSDTTIDELKCIDEASTLQNAPATGGTGPSTGLDLAKHQSQWWDNLPDYQMHLFLREATDHALTIDRLKSNPSAISITTLQNLMPVVADLVGRLKAWRPQAAFSAVRPEYAESVRYFNDIWRAGMLCFVYSEIYGLGSRDARVQGCVESALGPLRKLSWLQACLFPVFMIAVHASGEEARGVFLGKLEQMHGLLRFQGPASVAQVLRCVWQRMDESGENEAVGGGGKVEWREIVRDLGMELNILL